MDIVQKIFFSFIQNPIKRTKRASRYRCAEHNPFTLLKRFSIVFARPNLTRTCDVTSPSFRRRKNGKNPCENQNPSSKSNSLFQVFLELVQQLCAHRNLMMETIPMVTHQVLIKLTFRDANLYTCEIKSTFDLFHTSLHVRDALSSQACIILSTLFFTKRRNNGGYAAGWCGVCQCVYQSVHPLAASWDLNQ